MYRYIRLLEGVFAHAWSLLVLNACQLLERTGCSFPAVSRLYGSSSGLPFRCGLDCLCCDKTSLFQKQQLTTYQLLERTIRCSFLHLVDVLSGRRTST